MLRSELLEREAEARRLELAATFDELRARATPGHMLDQIVDYASDSGGADFFRNLRDQTVANPLALGLVGAGLAWLMLSSRDGRRGYDPYAAFDPDAAELDAAPRRRRMRGYLAGTRERAGYAMSGAGHLVSGAAAGVRDRVTGAAQGAAHMATGAAQGAAHLATGVASGLATGATGAAHMATGAAHVASDFASDMAAGAAGSLASTARGAREAAFGTAASLGERAGDTTSAALSDLGDAASAMYGGVSQTAGRTASGVRAFASGTASTGRDMVDLARDQPLVLAGLGLALGAAVGAAFASTERERRLMGEASHDLKERGYDFAAENYDKSRSLAEAVYDEFQHRVREGSRPSAAAAGQPAAEAARPVRHATSLVPLEEEEITDIQETIRPERFGLRDGRS
jgi:hypothetical protein